MLVGIRPGVICLDIEANYNGFHGLSVQDGMCSDLWLIEKNGICQCGITDFGVVLCDFCTKEIVVLNCYCMTNDSITGHMVLGKCLYTCANSSQYDHDYTTAPTNCTTMNRRGTLCGECNHNTYTQAYSYDMDCIECKEHRELLLYIVVAFVPLTLFIMIVLFCRINVVSPKMWGFVFYCQIFAAPINVRPILLSSKHKSLLVNIVIKVFMTLYGVWNLDFFRTLYPGVCLKLTTLQVLALDYLIAVYPILLMVIAYALVELHRYGFKPVIIILWRPFHKFFVQFRREWNIQTSIVDAFVTFFILSTTKMFNVSFDLLVPTELYIATGHSVGPRLYYNSNIEYMGQHHFGFGVLSVVVFTLFILLPLSFLIMTSLCITLRFSRCRTLQISALRECLYSFQQYYKDGSEGSTNCQWFSFSYIFIFLTIYLTYTFTLSVIMYSFCVIIFIVVAMVVLIVEPYKKEYSFYNIIYCVTHLLLALFFASITMLNISRQFQIVYSVLIEVFLSFISTIPLLYITVVIIQWIWKRSYQRDYQTTVDVEESLPYRIAHSGEYRQQQQ